MKRTICEMAMGVLVLVGLGGCKDEANPCDSTTYLSGSDCLPKTDAAAPTADLAPPAIDSESGEAGRASLLGMPCTDNVTHAECQGPDTNYCAIQPPATVGYCTQTGCAVDSDCPPNWTCFDLSKINVTGYPPMCIKA